MPDEVAPRKNRLKRVPNVPKKEKEEGRGNEKRVAEKPRETTVEFLASLAGVLVTGLFIITFERICSRRNFISVSIISAYQPEGAFPARYLQQMSYHVGEVIKSITHGGRSGKVVVQIARRPVNQKWAPNDIFARHESPVSAVLAVIAIVTQNKIVALGNNQLVVFHQFRHFFPPFRIHSVVGRIRAREVVAIKIAERGDVLHVGLVKR